MSFPNLFLVGAMKAGTTALYSWLEAHPLIYMSPIKEPNYFCSDLWDLTTHVAPGTAANVESARASGLHTAIVRDEDLYLRLFPENGEPYRYLGESSPTYLRSRVAAANIARRSPDAKIIIVMRDPIERAWSHFIMERNEARVPETFDRLMQDELRVIDEGRLPQHGILDSGLYYAGISRFLSHFDRANILIADSAELRKRDPFVARLNTFLGFDRDLFPADAGSKNPSLAPKYPRINRFLAGSGLKQLVRSTLPRTLIDRAKRAYYGKAPSVSEMDARSQEQLIAFYRDDVKQLVALLGRDAPSWTAKYSG